LLVRAKALILSAMSTLSEIEAAIEDLPAAQQEELLAYLMRRIKKPANSAAANDDPFAKMIGAFAGPHEATGRHSEELLYGKGA
jgi:hypothetical protein